MEKDYYKILGVEEKATEEQIKKAYLKKNNQLHPDRVKGKEEELKAVNEAFSVLSVPSKREEYDYQRKYSRGGNFSSNSRTSWSNEGVDFEDIFRNFSGFSSHSSTTRKEEKRAYKGEDINISLKASLKEIFNGFSKKISYKYLKACNSCSQTGAFSKEHLKKCENCKGTGMIYSLQRILGIQFQSSSACRNCNGLGEIISRVCNYCKGEKFTKEIREEIINFPHGLNDGETISFRNLGNEGFKNTIKGNLNVSINLEKNEFFEKKNYDVHLNLPISFINSLLGENVEVVTVDSRKIVINIPVGSESGDTITLNNEGFYRGIESSYRGNFVIHLLVKFPKNVSTETKEIIQLLRKKAGESNWNPNLQFIKNILKK